MDKEVFYDFKDKLFFDVFLSLEKEEKQDVYKSIYPPDFILQNKKGNADGASFIIGFLFDKVALTGTSQLSLRSLNKLEQMWSGHLLDFIDSPWKNPQSLVINSYVASISGKRTFRINNSELLRNLQIFMIEVDSFVLTLYMVEPFLDNSEKSLITEFVNHVSIASIHT